MNALPALRIGIDATQAGIANGERGGVYQYIHQLVRHVGAASPNSELQLMFALPHHRHTSTIRRFVEGLDCQNVVSRCCPLPMRYLRRWRIPVDLFLGRIDVFHAPAHLGLRCRTSPVVVTVHDLAYLRDRGGESAPAELESEERRQWEIRRGFLAELAEGMEESVREARFVIAVSNATRDDLVEAFGIASAKVRVVHLGVRDDVRRVGADICAAVTTPYGLRTSYWLYVGVLDPNKNLVAMLEGYARYRRHGGKRALAIAGQSAFYGTALRRRAKALGIEDDVVFLGYVPDAHLPALYSAATAVVMPSPLEGFGLPALEAMACGTPVIAAGAGALPEVVGDAGLLVEASEPRQFADAMQRLDDDGALCANLAVAGMRRSTQFSWERAALETLGVYAEAAGRQR